MSRGHLRKRGATWSYVREIPTAPGEKRKQEWRSGFRTRALAQAALTRALAESAAGTYQEPSKLTVAEYLEQWLQHVATENLAQTTVHRYRQHAARLAAALGRIPLTRLSSLDIQRHYATLGPSAVHHQHRVLRRALTMALRWQLIPRRPTDGVSLPRYDAPESQALDATQLRALLAAAGAYLLPVALAAMAGLRRGEVCGLQWKDVDLDAATLTVRRSRTSMGGQIIESLPKSRKPRIVPLPTVLVGILRATGPGDGYVVLDEHGAPLKPDRLSKAMGDLCASSKLPRIRFHDLRHSHATLLMERGVPMKIISDRLGHSTIQITADLYLHSLKDSARAAADEVEKALNPPPKESS